METEAHRDIRKLSKGVVALLGAKLIGKGLTLLLQIIIARTLGPHAFGLYALGWSLFRILGSVAPLGLNTAILRFAAPCWEKDRRFLGTILNHSLGVAFLSGLSAGIGLFLAAPWLANLFGEPELKAVFRSFALGIPFFVGLVVAAAATRASQHMRYSIYAVDLGQPLANMAFVLLLAILIGISVEGMVAACVASFAVAMGIALIHVRSLYKDVLHERPPFSLSSLLRFSLPVALTGIIGILHLQVDRLLVGYYLKAEDVGIYQAASQLSMLFVILLNIFHTVLAPMIAHLYETGEHKRLEGVFRVSVRWELYLCLPLFIVFLTAPNAVLTGVFGDAYGKGSAALAMLSSAQLIHVATGTISLILIMGNRQKSWLRLSAMGLFSNILLDIALIPPFGIMGAAVATAVSLGFLFLAAGYEAKRHFALWAFDSKLGKGILSGLATYGLLFFFFPRNDTIITIGLEILLAYGLFASGLAIMGWSKEEKAFLKTALARIL